MEPAGRLASHTARHEACGLSIITPPDCSAYAALLTDRVAPRGGQVWGRDGGCRRRPCHRRLRAPSPCAPAGPSTPAARIASAYSVSMSHGDAPVWASSSRTSLRSSARAARLTVATGPRRLRCDRRRRQDRAPLPAAASIPPSAAPPLAVATPRPTPPATDALPLTLTGPTALATKSPPTTAAAASSTTAEDGSVLVFFQVPRTTDRGGRAARLASAAVFIAWACDDEATAVARRLSVRTARAKEWAATVPARSDRYANTCGDGMTTRSGSRTSE